ncbi:CidA/LrgA family protein [Sporomusa malonica]|uniref:Holin-like protein n=1 Tax=Sporomusa malonica TaxID=112901 RepID=A0A1W1ZQW6_9FIRM|nr:CidA/LrgA family protein [Sporomusa malonica]SMC50747.1 holin-like protein [Sporomusa malonica]
MKGLQMLGQGVLLWMVYWLGNQISLVSGLPIPGNVFGMMLLFVLLLFGVIKLHYIQDAADFLLKHMLFLFIPIAVGLMNWGAVFYEYGIILALALVAGAVFPLFAVGVLTQALHKGDKECNH